MILKLAQTVTALALLAAAAPAEAAGLRLRAQCQPQGPVVLLGDVAEVLSGDPQETAALTAIELFPAPPNGQQRFLALRELQDALTARGVNLAKLQISGAAQVVVRSLPAAPNASPRPAPAAVVDSRRAEHQVRLAVLRRLQQLGAGADSAAVELRLTDEHVRAVSAASRAVAVTGGAAPVVGLQCLELIVEAADGPKRFPLEVQIAAPQAVVVAARTIAKGELIRPGDVSLTAAHQPLGASEGISSLEAVVGREAARAIPNGRPLAADDTRAPVVVRRGDVVTVYARSPGIRVKTVARARQDGSLGELVEMESLSTRKAFIARVSGFQEAEVFGQALPAASNTAAIRMPEKR